MQKTLAINARDSANKLESHLNFRLLIYDSRCTNRKISGEHQKSLSNFFKRRKLCAKGKYSVFNDTTANFLAFKYAFDRKFTFSASELD